MEESLDEICEEIERIRSISDYKKRPELLRAVARLETKIASRKGECPFIGMLFICGIRALTSHAFSLLGSRFLLVYSFNNNCFLFSPLRDNRTVGIDHR